jgi:hypothetical protein
MPIVPPVSSGRLTRVALLCAVGPKLAMAGKKKPIAAIVAAKQPELVRKS